MNRGVVIYALTLAIGACSDRPRADVTNAEQVARGKRVYEAQCSSCHGAKLEGQPNWRARLASGKFPAPPHDASGHTWHHPDTLLFDIVKNGVERHAPSGHRSDMPAFGKVLSDEEIWAALAYIKSTWPAEARDMQAEVTRNAAQR